MNQAYLLLLCVTSDLFLLVSMVRSLKCCQQRRSALMVSNEVSTRVDLYSSCLRFCKWAGIAPLMFHFAMGWNCSAHASFRNGLELLRPCFFSQWAGIAPPMFRFAMGGNYSAHVLSCWCSTGLLFLCLMSCWWLDSIFFILSPVGARRDFCFFV
jgi:hypothetical protein